MTWPNTVTKQDLKIEWFSGTGAGGQHRNKHQNCCRMTHIPTGITVQSQEERSRAQNQKIAFNRLADILIPIMKREVVRARYAAGTERVRTYHEPDDRVIDHRIPDQQWSYSDILSGKGISKIIKKLKGTI